MDDKNNLTFHAGSSSTPVSDLEDQFSRALRIQPNSGHADLNQQDQSNEDFALHAWKTAVVSKDSVNATATSTPLTTTAKQIWRQES